jgi:hypothetical protein
MTELLQEPIVGDGFYICRFQVSMNSNALRLLFVTLSPGSKFIWNRHPIDMSNDLIVPCSEENLNFPVFDLCSID